MDKFEQTHLRRVAAYERLIDSIYKQYAAEAAKLAYLVDEEAVADGGFTFDRFPSTHKRIDKLMERFKAELTFALTSGIRREWALAQEKHEDIARKAFGQYLGQLPPEAYNHLFNNRQQAVEQFLARKEQGLNLSDSVWNYTNQYKAEIEQTLELGIMNGHSADVIQRDLQQYLRNPDIRRFAYKKGVDDTGKPIYGHKWKMRYTDEQGRYRYKDIDLEDTHTGQGVYRSSYKNARRLAGTETNIAYRTSDYERVQQEDFVVGIRVCLSPTNHSCKGDKHGKHGEYHDICDELAGDYPKDFKFVGWHPNCRCHTETILKDRKEFIRDLKAEMRGETPEGTSVNEVKTLPDKFTKWVGKRAADIGFAVKNGKVPYFIRDNWGMISALPEMAGQAGVIADQPVPAAVAVPAVKPAEQHASIPAAKPVDNVAAMLDRVIGTDFLYDRDIRIFEKIIPKFNLEELLDDIVDTGLDIHQVFIDTPRGEDGNSLEFVVSGEGWKMRRYISNEEGRLIVTHSYWEFDRNLQGKGYSKKIMGALFKQYKACGVDMVQVHANIDAGGYCWAKYGFTASKSQALSQCMYDIEHPVSIEFKRIIEEFYSTHAEDVRFPMNLLAHVKGAKEYLHNASWYGQIDLHDTKQMEYVIDYIYGG